MKAPAHGAIAAGLSSTVVAGWTRHRARKAYDPEQPRPPLKQRLRQRAPIAVAGLTFTGLSTAVAYSFDTIEAAVLADSDTSRSIFRQGNHRKLHSLPYLGTVVGGAHLIRHGAARVARWVTAHLDISDQAAAVAGALADLAEWIIDGAGFGYAGHLLGDLPTKGRGGVTALRLLHPITDWNFCRGWVAHDANPANRYLAIAGVTLAGAAWAVNGIYLASWKPPEQQIDEHVQQLRDCDSFGEAADIIVADIADLFERVLPQQSGEFWNSALFESSYDDVHPELDNHWFHHKIDPEAMFGLERLDPVLLVERNIWPVRHTDSSGVPIESIVTKIEGVPLDNDSDIEGVPLDVGEPVATEDVPLGTDSSRAEDGVPLDGDPNEEGVPLDAESTTHETPLTTESPADDEAVPLESEPTGEDDPSLWSNSDSETTIEDDDTTAQEE